jgi:5-hydroxyisourate hydrolase
VAISTHVLDAQTGRPAPGVGVRLATRGEAGWLDLASAMTDADGRVHDLPAPDQVGVARLTFDTGEYLGDQTFYPEVTITFRVTDLAEDLHVPLLLSPYAYSTYRGS